MKLFYVSIILIFFQNCSFDNKTGIWKNENNASNKDKNLFEEFEKLSTTYENFDKIIKLSKDIKLKQTKAIDNFEWNDIFYNKTNNFKNYKYNDQNKLLFKSKKITKYKVNDHLLFSNNNLIANDQKGNLIVFSINENKIISKFNFYKKKYKKTKKFLNYIVENNIIYVSDNIGFLYAFDYKKNKIIWAKNYKVPFRSNLKISDNKLMAVSQNNNLYFYDKETGDVLSSIPTEETIVQNKFINNLSLSNNNQILTFLNTYGSLYGIENKSMRVKWVLNLNPSVDLNPSNLFNGNQILVNNDNIIASSDQSTYVINIINGSIIYKKNFAANIKPIINNKYLFALTNNDLLIAMDLDNGNIIYSYDINQKISEFLDVKKKKAKFKNMMMVNNKILIFLKNSYILIFNVNGELEDVRKLPSKLNTFPMVINSSILYLDYKNKISVID